MNDEDVSAGIKNLTINEPNGDQNFDVAKLDVISVDSLTSSCDSDDDDSDAESCVSTLSKEPVKTSKKLHCLLCDYSCSNVLTLKKHIYNHLTGKKARKPRGTLLDDVANASLKCTKCDFVGRCTATLKTHLKEHKKSSKQTLIDLAELDKDFTCGLCHFKCFGAKAMADHIRSHDGDQLTCHLCGYKCAKFGYLVLHTRLHEKELSKVVVKTPPSNTKLFQCTLCDFRSPKLLALTTHISTHSLPQLFACGVCSARFTTQKNLKAHAAHHRRGEDKPYMCPHCDHKYTRADNLRVHMRNHTGDKPYMCDVCDFKCTRADILKSHMRGHTGEKPYACTKCAYRCRQPGLLKVHMRSHTGERPFECHICGKNFGFAMNLKVHMRTHTGEKPFACMMCDYRSTTAMNLRTHTAGHEEQKFACGHCDYKCSNSESLKKHEITHLADRFECDVCHFKTNRVQSIRKHVQAHPVAWIQPHLNRGAGVMETPRMTNMTSEVANLSPRMYFPPQIKHPIAQIPHLVPEMTYFNGLLPQCNWMGLEDSNFHQGPVRVIKIQSPFD